MPGLGRGGIIPGLGRGPPGPPPPGPDRGMLGRGGMPEAGPGRGPAARGCPGAAPTPNGLLPTRGPGRGVGGAGRGTAVGAAEGPGGPGGVCSGGVGGTGAAGAGIEGGGGAVTGRTGSATGTVAGASTVPDGRSAAVGCGVVAVDVVDAAALLRGSARWAGAGWVPPAGNDSRNRLATGASTVDEALLTNSPISPSLLRISLLDTPSSLASSCTRALPATSLLYRTGRHSRTAPV